jgi:hypothetical protein
MLIKDPDIQPFLKSFFETFHATIDHTQQVENALVTSDTAVLKRLTATETVLGLNDYSNPEDEEQGKPLPEQISKLCEKVMNLEESVQNKPIMKSDIMLTTKTENRAKLLVEHLKHQVKERSENKALSSEEIVHFLKYEIDEKYRVISKNIRQTKKEVLEKAVELFHDIVFLSKKAFGRRNVRIVFRS